MIHRPGMWPWFLQRITGALLIIWLAVHLAVLHWGGHESQFFFSVTRRLGSGGWIAFDLLLIVLCLYHGLNGVRAVLYDLISGNRERRAIDGVLWVVGLSLTMVGYFVLAGFITRGGGAG